MSNSIQHANYNYGDAKTGLPTAGSQAVVRDNNSLVAWGGTGTMPPITYFDQPIANVWQNGYGFLVQTNDGVYSAVYRSGKTALDIADVRSVVEHNNAFIFLHENGTISYVHNNLSNSNLPPVLDRFNTNVESIFVVDQRIILVHKEGGLGEIKSVRNDKTNDNDYSLIEKLSFTDKNFNAVVNSDIPVTAVYDSNDGLGLMVLRGDGSVVTALASSFTPNTLTPEKLAKLDGTIDVLKVFSSGSQFAALREDGSVVEWRIGGGVVPNPSDLDGHIKVVDIKHYAGLFVALREDGSAVTWGTMPAEFKTATTPLLNGQDAKIVSIHQSGGNDISALRTDGSLVVMSIVVSEFIPPNPANPIVKVLEVSGQSTGGVTYLRADGSVASVRSEQNWTADLKAMEAKTPQIESSVIIDVESRGGSYTVLRADGTVDSTKSPYYDMSTTTVDKWLDGAKSPDGARVISLIGEAPEYKVIETAGAAERIQVGSGHRGLAQDAGDVIQLVSMGLGEAALTPTIVGLGLAFSDRGMTELEIAQIIVNTELFEQRAGDSHHDIVNYLYMRAVGVAPAKADLNFYVGQLDRNETSEAALLILAANSAQFEANSHIIGHHQTGVEYLYG